MTESEGFSRRAFAPLHLTRDLERLGKRLLIMGAAVEEMLHLAMTALIDRREDIAVELIERDVEIDAMEVQIEQECLKVLALHQPVANDLRFVITSMKVVNDLERMGDQALNIGRVAKFIARRSPIQISINFPGMVDRVQSMVKRSLDSLVNLDVSLAVEVCGDDDEVDRTHSQMYAVVKKLMRDSPEAIDSALDTLSASRHLERIADLATNIAEDVIFMVEGKIVRHHNGMVKNSNDEAERNAS